MNYTLAVFKSRYSTLSFANLLKRHNIPVAIINTPRILTQTCGISVKFLSDYFSKVQTLLMGVSLKNFDGFYCYCQRNGEAKLIKL